MTEILDAWPYPFPPRSNQVEALQWLAEQKAKYLILEAPVGSGKSNLALTYARYIGGSSFVLTPQRILQEQYTRDNANNPHINLASLYGKSNYTCKSKDCTCEVGSLVKPECKPCPHKLAKEAAKSSQYAVFNYKLGLTLFAYTNVFSTRRLMVLDECHQMEQGLVDFDALSITEWRCKKYGLKFQSFKDMSKAQHWLHEYYSPALRSKLNDLEMECEPLFEKRGTDLTRAEINKIRELSGLQEHHDTVMDISLHSLDYLNEHYVLVWGDPAQLQFKRLKGVFAFHKYIKPFAEKFLFMSSTMPELCADLGLPEEETATISLDSTFPVENRPVVFIPRMKMNASWNNKENANSRQKMLDTVLELLKTHQYESGIIHTGNFAISEWLVSELIKGKFASHKIYHHNPSSKLDRNAVITAFQEDPNPSVLISPSSTEGLDLKEDLGRFAIVVKIPFGHLGDQWIKRRMDMSMRWYQRRALIDIIQGSGRVVRSAEDWGNTYILDGSWSYLYNQTYHMIPKWWRRAYQVLR